MGRAPLKRYLAEFLLIVAGVVTGLIAEGWVSGLRERSQAGEIQSRLVEDLRVDAREARLRVTFYRRVRARAESVLEGLSSDGPVEDPAGFVMKAFDASRMYPLPVSRPTWDDLSATGRLDLLDPEARLILGEYYRGLFSRDSYVNDFSDDYRKRVRSILPVPLQDFANRDCSWFAGLEGDVDVPCSFDLSAEDAEALASELQSDVQLRLDLNWLLSQVTTAVQLFEIGASDATDLVSRLEEH